MKFDGSTRLLGLLGDPVVQARTPAMANRLLDQQGRLGPFVLVPMHISSNELSIFVSGLRTMQNFAGAVVTMPHKTSMVGLVDELTPEASLVGAVNVICRTAGGKLIGTVLDGEGFVGGLKLAGHGILAKACVLVGAGGAASAIAFALTKHGCSSLCLLNRTSSKSSSLAERLRIAFPKAKITTSLPQCSKFDIVINGTSLGMRPGDPLPMDESLIDRANLVAECVIAPEVTPLLDLAKRRGRQTHTGLPMLSAQIDLMLSFMGVE